MDPRKCRRITRIENSYPDRISNLPGNVVDNVLRFLPLRDAVMTSILAREWRYKWTTIPNLEFDNGWVDESFLRNNNMEDIINQVLLQHRGSIHKFVLYTHDFRPCLSNIDEWFLLLSKHKIHEFMFMNGWKGDYVIPTPLFAFKQLRHLTLTGCVLFNPPPESKGLKQLITLRLMTKAIELTSFENFISQCPLLKKLTLFCCSKFDSLKINVPSLKYFRFYGNWTSICCRNCSNLAEVVLWSRSRNVKNQSASTLDKVMCSMPTIHKLEMDHKMLKFFAGGYVPTKLSATLLHLKFICLKMNLSKVTEVSCVLCLIRSCQNLQVFRIGNSSHKSGDYEAVVDLLRAQKNTDCLLNNLKKFSMRYGYGACVESEREFLKYILAFAPVLTETKLWVPDITGGAGVMVKELKQFPQASPKITLRLCGKGESCSVDLL